MRGRRCALDAPLPDQAGEHRLALGRLRGGADAGQRSLRAWLAAPDKLAEAAGLALGTLASRTDRLDDATLVALLDAASRPEAPVASALQAFTRLTRLDDAVAPASPRRSS